MFTGEVFFLRPEWLLLIVVLFMLIIFILRRHSSPDKSAWSEVIDSHLLKHLAVPQQNTSKPKFLLIALFVSLFACIIAMAGPTWEKNKRPAFKSSEPVVLVMSLAQSMNTEDVSPNRLTRASHKTIDILNTLKGNDIGLVIYSDRPFTATPLTTDTQLIKEMLPELSPNLMPVLGNRLDLAIDQAVELLHQTGAQDGQIIVMANSAGDFPQKSIDAAKKAAVNGFKVNVLGIGTIQGGELITASGQPIVDETNQVMLSKLETTELTNIASVGSGHYANLSADNSDIDSFIKTQTKLVQNITKSDNDRGYDDWHDMGFWLLLIPVMFAPLAFQRGLLMSIPLIFVISSVLHTSEAEALVWKDLWRTQDQQAQRHYEARDYSQAAQQFQNQPWRASALYKAGRFKEAASQYRNSTDEKSNFNLGNALAYSGEFEKAINAYDLALEKNPSDEDALFNRELVANLLQQEQSNSNEESADDDKAKAKSTENGKNESTDNTNPANSDNKLQNNADNMNADHDSQDQQADHSNQPTKQNKSSGDSQTHDPESGQSQSDTAQQQSGPNQTKAGADTQNSNKEVSQSNAQSQMRPSSESKSDHSTAKRGEDKQPLKETTGHSSADRLSAAEQSTESDSNDTQTESETISSNIETAKNLLDKTMDKLLKGNQHQRNTDKEHADTGQMPITQSEPLTKLSQTAEQMLRTVPDNSSGLLKARIRQHYRRLMDGN